MLNPSAAGARRRYFSTAVLAKSVFRSCSKSTWRSVTKEDGKALFINKLHLIPGTKEKLESPLFGTVVRAAAKAGTFERASDILRHVAYSFRAYSRPEWNHLIPLENDAYECEAHEQDLLSRQSRRSGMLLNRDELMGLVHFPSAEVRSSRLLRERTRTKQAPALSSGGILLGYNRHAGQASEVRLSADQRVQHIHVIGASGTGKSTFLFNLIQQDIESGQGVGVIDPHGDLIDRIVESVPEHRIKDVILFDPTDEEYSIGFNILSAHTNFEKTLLASDLVSVFRRLSSSWGDQLNSVLNNAILAFLESSVGGTLPELQQFLIDARYRASFLETVTDPDIVYYWSNAFPQLGGNRSIGPVITRLNAFLAPKSIRYMVSQSENRLNFGNILDQGKIFLAKLSKGMIGEENSFLLGSLLVTKFQQQAMTRQRLSLEQRRDFWLYLDECHNFITPSIGEILSGTRKYRLGLVLAHHDLKQLEADSKLAGAIMSNPATRVCFRVGDEDAETLAEGFSYFKAQDLQNLETGEAIARIQRSGFDFNLSVNPAASPDPATAKQRREQIVTASREKYATARAHVEATLQKARLSDRRNPLTDSLQGPVVASTSTSAQDSGDKPLMSNLIGTTSLTTPEVAPTPKAFETPAVQPVPDQGRGGAQHQAIQRRLKEAAEELGFRSTIESSCSGGSVDLLLERDGETIACEISFTTAIDHEVGNVTKCLQAGFGKVAVICLEEARLQKLAAAVKGSLGSEASMPVGFYKPDQFIDFLRAIPRPARPALESVAERRGYKVKRTTPALSQEERRRRESEAIRMIAEFMQTEKR